MGIFASDDIKEFYLRHIKEHGVSPRGVGWKDEFAQSVRFEQLAKVINLQKPFTLNDLGCGTAEFYKYLSNRKYTCSEYMGYDLLDEMIEEARKNIGSRDDCKLSTILTAENIAIADYTVASGIFNVKYSADDEQWLTHILKTIATMHQKSIHGFSFNLLTSYSDKSFMQSYLYYADPCYFFDFCKKNFSKNVALLHDYDQYDFTIVVRKLSQFD
jgi:hypothetical protein